MNKEIQLKYVGFGILFLIISFLVFLPNTDRFNASPADLSFGILLDLLITIPILYFLIIKNTKIPNFTLVYVFILGLLLASFLIPIEHQQILTKVKYIGIPIIEIGIFSMVVYKIVTLKTILKKATENDFYDKLITACQEIFPGRIGRILATEIAMGYYLFGPKNKSTNNDLAFTYFKKSGIKTVISILLFLLVVETFLAHFLLAKWNTTIAWILSVLGVYTILQIVSILRSLDKRPILINEESEELILRYGFGSQTKIPFNSIVKIEKYQDRIRNDKNHIFLSLFDLLDTNNITIHLKNENVLNKIYGIEKKFKSISLFVDEKDAFIEILEKHIETE